MRGPCSLERTARNPIEPSALTGDAIRRVVAGGRDPHTWVDLVAHGTPARYRPSGLRAQTSGSAIPVGPTDPGRPALPGPAHTAARKNPPATDTRRHHPGCTLSHI